MSAKSYTPEQRINHTVDLAEAETETDLAHIIPYETGNLAHGGIAFTDSELNEIATAIHELCTEFSTAWDLPMPVFPADESMLRIEDLE